MQEETMDYQEIIERKKAIVNSPIRPIPAEKLQKVAEEFHLRNPKSLKHYSQMKEVVPGGLQHNLGSTEPFALAFDKAKGAKVYDVDGNAYTDYLMDGGPIILGHHFEPLDDEVVKLISNNGPAVGLTHENELRFASEIIKNVPSVEMVRFVASGTEADMLAIRLARVVTGRPKIIKISGNYHGWGDQLILSLMPPAFHRAATRTSSRSSKTMLTGWHAHSRRIKAKSRLCCSNRVAGTPAPSWPTPTGSRLYGNSVTRMRRS
jgi:glutamate-1-semialdehyde 2,1-aminomutase